MCYSLFYHISSAYFFPNITLKVVYAVRMVTFISFRVFPGKYYRILSWPCNQKIDCVRFQGYWLFQTVSFRSQAKGRFGEPNGGPKGKHWQVRVTLSCLWLASHQDANHIVGVTSNLVTVWCQSLVLHKYDNCIVKVFTCEYILQS